MTGWKLSGATRVLIWFEGKKSTKIWRIVRKDAKSCRELPVTNMGGSKGDFLHMKA